MELNNLFQRQDRSDVRFFLISMIFWMVISSYIEPQISWSINNAAIYIIGGISFFFIFQTFESIAAVPVLTKKREIFGMTISLVCGATATDILLRQNSAGTSISYWSSLPLFIILVFFYSSFAYLMFRYQRRRKVVLDLSPQEQTVLCNKLKLSSIDKHSFSPNKVHCLNRSELIEHFENGKIEDIELIIIPRREQKGFDCDATLLRAHIAGIPILEVDDVICRISGHISLSDSNLNSYLLSATRKTSMRRIVLQMRYIAEPFLALLLGIALSPVLLITALLVRATSAGPIFYQQTRTGYLGKHFKLIKFRSMKVDAESNGPQWAQRHDTRVTAFGNFMRRTRLDELPQLWNIIRGEMSFIGPRPERPEIYEKLNSQIPLFPLRTLIRPGITGWAQVCSGYAASPDESLLKLEYDLFYIQHMCICFDIHILIRTLKIAFVGDSVAEKCPSSLQSLMQT